MNTNTETVINMNIGEDMTKIIEVMITMINVKDDHLITMINVKGDHLITMITD